MKHTISALLAALLVFGAGSLSVFAAETVDMPFNGTIEVLDDDGDTIDDFSESDGKITADVHPAKEYYIALPAESVSFGETDSATIAEITDDDEFSFKLDRDKNGGLLDSVSFVSKRFDGKERQDYIKVDMDDSDMTEDEKLTFDVYFKAKHSEEDKWHSGDRVNIRFELWVNNDVEDGEDADFEVGEDIVFNPVSNETNIINWGDNYDVATVKFEANDDADKFYAKLSTKANSQIYRDYGDPANADLFFRTFVGAPRLDTTSRATVTLYNPWSQDDDDDYDIDPYNVYIYEVDGGELIDITENFTYVHEDETEMGTDGWQSRTRTLGSYVLSDMPLDTFYDDVSIEEPVNEIVPEVPTKPNPAPVTAPPTGSSDFVGIASFGIIASLAAIGFFKKKK